MDDELDLKLLKKIISYYLILEGKNPGHEYLSYLEIEGNSVGIKYDLKKKFGNLKNYLSALKEIVE